MTSLTGLQGGLTASLTLLLEEAVEFLHDSCLHDLSEEGVLLSQLLGCEVLPAARGPLVVVKEVDEGGVGRLREELLVDICEEPGGSRGRPGERPGHGTETLQNVQTQGRHARVGCRGRVGPQMLLGTMHEVTLFSTSSLGGSVLFSACPSTLSGFHHV